MGTIQQVYTGKFHLLAISTVPLDVITLKTLLPLDDIPFFPRGLIRLLPMHETVGTVIPAIDQQPTDQLRTRVRLLSLAKHVLNLQ